MQNKTSKDDKDRINRRVLAGKKNTKVSLIYSYKSFLWEPQDHTVEPYVLILQVDKWKYKLLRCCYDFIKILSNDDSAVTFRRNRTL